MQYDVYFFDKRKTLIIFGCIMCLMAVDKRNMQAAIFFSFFFYFSTKICLEHSFEMPPQDASYPL